MRVHFLSRLQEEMKSLVGRHLLHQHTPSQVLSDAFDSVTGEAAPLFDVTPQPFKSPRSHFFVVRVRDVILMLYSTMKR